MNRRAEKKWRTTRLPADLAAFKKERNRVVNLMNEAQLCVAPCRVAA